eukprot:scpid24154/ scgid7654/ 
MSSSERRPLRTPFSPRNIIAKRVNNKLAASRCISSQRKFSKLRSRSCRIVGMESHSPSYNVNTVDSTAATSTDDVHSVSHDGEANNNSYFDSHWLASSSTTEVRSSSDQYQDDIDNALLCLSAEERQCTERVAQFLITATEKWEQEAQGTQDTPQRQRQEPRSTPTPSSSWYGAGLAFGQGFRYAILKSCVYLCRTWEYVECALRQNVDLRGQ